MTSGPAALAAFNAAPADAAAPDMLACCGSRAFARALVAGRPYPDPAALDAAIGTAFESLSWADVEEAVAAHPRIGEPAPDSWASAEQSGASTAADSTRAALAAGNRAYEQRFGHVFLICATGLTGDQLLAALRTRLDNDFYTERAVVRRELLAITRLRATKLLGA